MGVWYRTIATSASATFTFCLLMVGEVVAAPTPVTVPTTPESEVQSSVSLGEEPLAGDRAGMPPSSQVPSSQVPSETVSVEASLVIPADVAIAPEARLPADPQVSPDIAPQTEHKPSQDPTLHSQSPPSFDDIRVPGFEDEAGDEDETSDEGPPFPSSAPPSDPAQEAIPAETLGDTTDDGVPTADLLEGGDLSPLEVNPNPLQYPTLPEEVRLLLRQPITLEQALELARRNSRVLEQARLNLEQAQHGLRAAIAARYPQLNLTGNLVNSLASGTRLNLLQANQTTRRAGGNDVVEDPADRNADTTNYNLVLQLTYNIYSSGQRLNTIRAARAVVEDAELALEAAFEDLRFDVTDAYYTLQQEAEQLRIDKVSVGFREQNVKDAQALEQAGLGTRFEILQAEVELANDRQSVEQTQSRLTQARRELARQLSLPEVIDIDAADPIQKVGDWTLGLEESILTAYRNRAELAQQLAQRDVAEARRRAQVAQDGPQLNAVAQYDLFDALDPQDNFGPVYGYSASLQFSWNLFDGGADRALAAQQDSLRRQAENQFAIQREAVRFDVEQSYADLIANTASIRTALQAIEAAEEEVRLARLRFRAGVGTQTDRLNAETRFIRARGNVLLAIIGYNRAVSSLIRSVSNLPPEAVVPSAQPVSLPELTVEEVLETPPASFGETGDIFAPIPPQTSPADEEIDAEDTESE